MNEAKSMIEAVTFSTINFEPTISRSGIELPTLTTQEWFLNDSRITPSGNGNPGNKPYRTQPTGGQKLWAAIILGLIFALVSSPGAYHLTSQVSSSLTGATQTNNPEINFRSLIIQTIIFIIIMRIILW